MGKLEATALILLILMVFSASGKIAHRNKNTVTPSRIPQAEHQENTAEKQEGTLKTWDFKDFNQIEPNPAPKYSSENFDFIYSTFKDFIKSQNFLNKLSTSDPRYKGFSTVFEILFSNPPNIMVETNFNSFIETNCINKGCSSLIFGHLATNLNAKLYSLNPKNIKENGEIEEGNVYPGHVEIVFEKPADFLSVFDKGKIGFLYLNSEGCGEGEKNLKFDRLLEVMAAYPRLTEKATIMIDGCAGELIGSFELVHEFLTNKGWKLYFHEFQRIYIR